MHHKYRSKYIIFFLFTFLLTSCSSGMERFKSADNDVRKSQARQYLQDQKETRKSTNSSYWIVSRGETLEFIARSTAVPVEDIAYYNSLSKPYKLSDGMRLFIAKRKSSANIDSSLTTQANAESEDVSGSVGVYEVKAGDTISTISTKFGIGVKQLIEFNQIANPSLIFVGQKLKIAENKLLDKDKIIYKDAISGENGDSNITSDTKISISVTPQFRWPVLGRVINNYGDDVYGRINNGVYISAPLGSEVSASERGVVTFVGNEDYFGDLIIIKHLNNWVSSYAHLDKSNVLIGDKIEKGDIIGTVGASGVIESPQLYFELRRGTIVQDPTNFLN